MKARAKPDLRALARTVEEDPAAVLVEVYADDRVNTAFHEAGHAVVALLLGYEVSAIRVGVIADGDVRIVGDFARTEDLVTFMLAGCAAEQVRRGDVLPHPPDVNAVVSGSYRAEGARIFQYDGCIPDFREIVGASPPPTTIDAAWGDAISFLRRRWTVVERLAEALGGSAVELTGSRVREVFSEAGGTFGESKRTT